MHFKHHSFLLLLLLSLVLMNTLAGWLLFSCPLLRVHYLEEVKRHTEDVSSCDDSFNFDLPWAKKNKQTIAYMRQEIFGGDQLLVKRAARMYVF